MNQIIISDDNDPRNIPDDGLLEPFIQEPLPFKKVSDLVDHQRMSFETDIGKFFLREMYRVRRGYQRKYSRYLHLIKPKIEQLVLVMREEDVSPIEALFYFEHHVAQTGFEFRWMHCALLELLDPTDQDLITTVFREIDLALEQTAPPKALPSEIRQKYLKTNTPSPVALEDKQTFEAFVLPVRKQTNHDESQ